MKEVDEYVMIGRKGENDDDDFYYVNGNTDGGRSGKNE